MQNEEEIQERKLYNLIKSEFSAIKGTAQLFFLERVQAGFDRVDVVCTESDLADRLLVLIHEKTPYAVINNLDHEITYGFNGKTFRQQENLSSKELIFFNLKTNKDYDFKEIKKELKQLKELLISQKFSK